MTQELPTVIGPEIGIKEAVLSFWKYLIFDLYFKYYKKYQEYVNAKYTRDMARIESIVRDMMEIKQQIASLIYTILLTISHLIMELYFAKKDKFNSLPYEIKLFIKDFVDNKDFPKSFIEKQLSDDPAEISDIHKMILTLNIIMYAVGLLSIVEHPVGLR